MIVMRATLAFRVRVYELRINAADSCLREPVMIDV